MWGVGRFLYSSDIIKIKEVQEYNGKYYPVDKQGGKIWDITKHCNALLKKPTPNKVDITTDTKNLNDCKDLTELKTIYSALSSDKQKLLLVLKDKLKLELK